MYRTPAKKDQEQTEFTAGTVTKCVGPSGLNVRRSIGEWEGGNSGKPSLSPPKKPSTTVENPKPKPAAIRRLSLEAGSPPKPPSGKYLDRLAEAKACVVRAKTNLTNSRNLKAEIKTAVVDSVDRLYQLVKESELAKGKNTQKKQTESEKETRKGDEERIEGRSLEEIIKLLKENKDNIRIIKENLEKQSQDASGTSVTTTKVLAEVLEIRHASEETGKKISTLQESLPNIETLKTYANVAAAIPRRQLPEQTALHSVVVTAKDETETGDEVLNRIRKAVNAKEGGVQVERIRKAKDRKVIVGCRTEEERRKIKERISREGELIVEDIKNKDPLVIMRDLLQHNSDGDVLKALRNQNKSIFNGVNKEDDRMEIAYKRRTRNPHTSHVVMRVSPKLWLRMVEAEAVHIDLQRVRVGDHSPLVQCSLCLGYGHGRRFCKETLEKCSHCGGPHMKAQCADWLAGASPSCCNCMHAKLDSIGHNAFSSECPIRRKWDALARATVAYC